MNKISNKNFNDGNIAIAYYRYSSTAQNDDSIEQQRLAAQGFAKSNGLTIIKEYEDATVIIGLKQNPTHGRRFSPIFFA